MTKQKKSRRPITLEDLLVYECIEDTKETARREKDAKAHRAKQREQRLRGQ